MIDHLTLTVRDISRSKAFYSRALAPLGYAIQMEFEELAGIGPPGKPALWLKPGETPTPPMHLAFVAADRPGVDAFYAAALAAGAADNGGPGLRPDYHPSYYAAFVFDPEGHNIEAVCHRPPRAAATPRRKASTAPKAKSKRKGATRR